MIVAGCLSGVAVGALLAALASAGGAASTRLGSDVVRRFAPALRQWSELIVLLAREGVSEAGPRPFGGGRLLAVACLAAAIAGYALLGPVGALAATIAAPPSLRRVLRVRRDQRRAKLDDQAGELALAIASTLAAGGSARGALLVAGRAVPQPLAGELDRVALDLTLGASVGEALAALRARSGSARIATLAGAIELQRASGGDLIGLMRELASAFRARDRARRDAAAASAQARYTLLVVAAIPVVLGFAVELAEPGAVSGAIGFLPSAVMLAASVLLAASGFVLAHRTAAT